MFSVSTKPVGPSADLDRILALPRRQPSDLTPGSPRAEALVELMTARLRREDRPVGAPCGCLTLGRKHCIDRLLPAQAWALFEAPMTEGIFGSLAVGCGKTALNILVAMVIPGCKVAALFLPPGLVEQLIAEYQAIAEHFVAPSLVLPGGDTRGWLISGRPSLHVIPYSRLSRAESTDYLRFLNPDLIIADECHALKAMSSVRTSRLLRHYVEHPNTRFCAWSGSVTSKSIKDFSHLLAFALGSGSPLPIDSNEVNRWATAIDPSDWPAPAGALRALGEPLEPVRESVRRRMRDTRGFISTTSSSSLNSAIVLRERKPQAMPEELSQLIKDCRKSWARPDGEELIDSLSVAACARQLACGFFYRWRFPGNPPSEKINAWFSARKLWHKELREKLRDPRPHLDSPLLCAKAAIRYQDGYAGDLPIWKSETWQGWREVRNTIVFEVEPVWISDYLVKDACLWAKTSKVGVIWYENRALGEAVAKAAGVPLHDGGADAEKKILAERGNRSIVVSMKAHGTGRDGLQRLFCSQLVLQPPSSAASFEQLLGRLCRIGQESDEVVTYLYRHTKEMSEPTDKAIEFAKYIEGITGSNQLLLKADVEWSLKNELR